MRAKKNIKINGGKITMKSTLIKDTTKSERIQLVKNGKSVKAVKAVEWTYLSTSGII